MKFLLAALALAAVGVNAQVNRPLLTSARLSMLGFPEYDLTIV